MKIKTLIIAISVPVFFALVYFLVSAKPKTDTVSSQVVITNKVLAIIPTRCRGCGKCFRVDPLHFSVDASTGLAKVISQANLDSSDLKTAISLCHDQAISLK